jgi:4-amino-4-deoxy-L-arabinose transferase-like glycosyltransferase
MRTNIINIAAIIFFLISAWLLFANLSDHALSNDEAFNSVLARNIMRFGYPRSFDGLNYVYPDSPSFNLPGTYIFIADPWLAIYVTGLSFKLFGISTWSARILFVSSGLLTLVVLFIFCIRYLKSMTIAFISALLLGTNIPFLLHMRQARYYGLIVFLCLGIFYLYHRILEKEKGYFWLGLALILLMLSHHAIFIPVFGSILLMALLIDRGRIQWGRFIAASIAPICLFIPWGVFLLMSRSSDAAGFPVNASLVQMKKSLEFQVRTINGYFVPAAFWAVVLIFASLFKKISIFRISKEDSVIFKRIAIILASSFIFFIFFGLRTMRYYIYYLPFLLIIEAFLIVRIFRWQKSLAVVIILLIIFTNFFSRFNPAKLRSYFLDYLYEITHEYTGPLEALCDYLNLHAKPGDRIKIVKGDLTVMFYHPELEILNDARYFKKSYPEWIVIRRYWNPIFENIWKEKMGAEFEDNYLDVLDRYDKIPLAAVDSIRENVPDNLKEHFFKNPEINEENRMSVYRLRN